MPSHQTPLAHLITISCYGKRLHGEPTETVDRTHKTYGSDYVPTSPFAAQLEEAAMRSRAFEMTSTQRTLILSERSFSKLCSRCAGFARGGFGAHMCVPTIYTWSWEVLRHLKK